VKAVATRTITVTGATVLKQGNTAGKDWTLYDIAATGADGAAIDGNLRSFEKLEGEVEVEVQRQEHEHYGVSYMLKKAGAVARLGARVDDIRGRVEALEQRVEGLLDELVALRELIVGGGTAADIPF
jgi:hypothetical protein